MVDNSFQDLQRRHQFLTRQIHKNVEHIVLLAQPSLGRYKSTHTIYMCSNLMFMVVFTSIAIL